MPSATACGRSRAPSLPNSWRLSALMVSSQSNRSRPMAAYVCPRLMPRRICSSRSVGQGSRSAGPPAATGLVLHAAVVRPGCGDHSISPRAPRASAAVRAAVSCPDPSTSTAAWGYRSRRRSTAPGAGRVAAVDADQNEFGRVRGERRQQSRIIGDTVDVGDGRDRRHGPGQGGAGLAACVADQHVGHADPGGRAGQQIRHGGTRVPFSGHADSRDRVVVPGVSAWVLAHRGPAEELPVKGCT